MALLPGVGRLWTLARQVEDLFTFQRRADEALQLAEQRLRALEDRLLQLEREQGQIIIEARIAASAAAIVSHTVELSPERPRR